MKIYILGAGALGCVFGGALFLAGQDVTLFCHTPKQANIINEKGLDLRTGDIIQNVAIKAATAQDSLPPADLIIILVKSQHTRDAVQSIKKFINTNTLFLSLQNGMGHEDTIAEFVPKYQILAGKTYVGGVTLAPNCVIMGHQNKLTLLGELDYNPSRKESFLYYLRENARNYGKSEQQVDKIAELFNNAGLKTEISHNIAGTMWDKLFINVATGAVSAISGLCYGDLYQSKALETVAIGAVNEAIAIAKAKKIDISIHDGATAWKMASAGLPYNFKASMLQSLESGNRTEIDFINGYVVQKGIEMGIPTPFNQTLVACLKGIEQKKFDT